MRRRSNSPLRGTLHRSAPPWPACTVTPPRGASDQRHGRPHATLPSGKVTQAQTAPAPGEQRHPVRLAEPGQVPRPRSRPVQGEGGEARATHGSRRGRGRSIGPRLGQAQANPSPGRHQQLPRPRRPPPDPPGPEITHRSVRRAKVVRDGWTLDRRTCEAGLLRGQTVRPGPGVEGPRPGGDLSGQPARS